MENKSKKPDPQMVELYHNQGWMPDWAYYQLNGKSAQENYADQLNKRRDQFFEDRYRSDYSDVHITSEVKIKK